MTTVEMENHQNINSFFYRVLLFNPVLGSKTKPSRKHNHIPIIFFNYRIQLSEFTIFFSSQRFSLLPIQNINSRWMNWNRLIPTYKKYVPLPPILQELSFLQTSKTDEARLSMSLCPPSLPPPTFLWPPPPFHGQLQLHGRIWVRDYSQPYDFLIPLLNM